MPRTRRPRSRALVAGVEALEARQVPASLVVSNVLDAGPGSLRQAILDANADPDASEVDFAIPGAGVQAIRLAAALPTITAPVAIDATTQPGYEGTPVVALDGSQAGAGAGLSFNHSYFGGGSSVAGLAIERFRGDGIVINTATVAVRRSFIGLDPTGAGGGGNVGAGIRLDGSLGAVVGGQPADANVIAGNGGDGIFLRFTRDVQVTSNFIGTDAAGRADLGNGGNGVSFGNPTGDYNSNAYVGSNVIANNGRLAVDYAGTYMGLPSVIGPNLESSNGRRLPDFALTASTTAVGGSTGDVRTVAYTVTNRGPGVATNVRFRLSSANAIRYFDVYTPPQIFEFAGATTTRGAVDPDADPNRFGSSPLVTIEELAPGASATITASIRLANPGDDALNASIVADQPTVAPPDAVSTTIAATGRVDLAATALPTPGLVPVGSPVALTFLVTNRDATSATMPDVTLALPGPDVATVLAINSSRGTLDPVAGRPNVYAGRIVGQRPGAVYYLDLVGLAAGESATITVVLVPLRDGPILATLATTAPSNADPDLANNLAIAGTVAGSAPPAAVAPTLASVALGTARGGSVRSVVLGFSLALDASRAEDVRNYRLTTGGRPLGLRSATYDAATGHVTLRLARPLAARGTPVRVRLVDGGSVGLRAADRTTPVAGAIVAAPRRGRVAAAREARR